MEIGLFHPVFLCLTCHFWCCKIIKATDAKCQVTFCLFVNLSEDDRKDIVRPLSNQLHHMLLTSTVNSL